MGKETPSFLNPCLKEAQQFQQQIKSLNSVSRLIPNGDGGVSFEKFYKQSLFGYFRPREESWDQMGVGGLTPLERRLLTAWEKEKIFPKILTVIDFDGVLASPSHTIYNVGRKYITGEVGLSDLPRATRERGKISFSNLRGLSEISDLSDSTIVWTSRINLSDNFWQRAGVFRKNLNWFRDSTISYFPFFDQDSQIRLSKFGHNKLAVETNKNLISPEKKLYQIIESCDPQLTYYIGSSSRDRRAVAGFLRRYPHMGEKLVFFDTCRWYF